MNQQKNYITGFVQSKDGSTTVRYRQFGQGSGLILVHGGLMGVQNLMKLGHSWLMNLPSISPTGVAAVPALLLIGADWRRKAKNCRHW